jgi:uncharacterized lipoprotein YddW (UPF0748 family)
LLLFSLKALAGPLVIDDFIYANSSLARAAWVGGGGPAVSMAWSGDWGTSQVMVLTCDFSQRASRCYWDRSTRLNLSAYTDIALEVYTPNPAPISQFTLYFQSGAGWYGASASLKKSPGWQTLRFAVSDFTPEGSPAGWDRIDGIRFSAWKGAAQDTYLAVDQLRAFTPAVLLVRDPQSSNPEVVQQTIDRHRDWLGGYQIDCGVITRAGVEAGLLQQSQLAILPYNESVSETEMLRYEGFVTNGGRLIVYYLLPGRLASLLGVRVTGWTQGDFAAWSFSDAAIPGLPERVMQSSWNITLAEPSGSYHGRVSAWWLNGQGQSTGKAAWLATDRGFFMSHVLLGDDAAQKSYALLCLVGSITTNVWPAAARGAIDEIGRVGPYQEYGAASAGIRQQASATLRARTVEVELGLAEGARNSALSALATNQFQVAIQDAHAARAHLKEAYLRSLKPVYPEFRAIWEHHATGPYPGNWPGAIAALVTNGLTAVFPNMLWGGLAHYNSAFLPHSTEFSQYGDQITACVEAAHARGVQVHVWKVNWNLSGAPQNLIDTLRAANRTQVTRTGAPVDWLCPSHPDNLALETNSMLEVVRNYDVDGIHFDYIRYPNSDCCYCTGCWARFQSQTGRSVPYWPADVLAAGSLRTAFLDWRRSQITRLVETVYAGVKGLKPSVRVSAAVFPDPASAYDDVGQDWRRWVTNGIVDFLCPMDYTADLVGFADRVHDQLASVGGKVPLYPGIGAFVLENDATLAQLQVTREAGTGGFIVFELSPTSAASLLPAFSAGATAPDEPDTDSDSLPDSWEQQWFGSLAVSGSGSDTDRDGISDAAEYVLGTNPTLATSPLTLEIKLKENQVELSFQARGVETVGYRNATRHYRLECAVSPIQSGNWTAVPPYEDLTAAPGQQTMVCDVSPEAGAARFYRLRVWLQEQR